MTTIVIALIARAIGATDFADGIGLGIVLGVGFGVVGALVSQIYEGKGGSYWLINGGQRRHRVLHGRGHRGGLGLS